MPKTVKVGGEVPPLGGKASKWKGSKSLRPKELSSVQVSVVISDVIAVPQESSEEHPRPVSGRAPHRESA